MPAALPDLVVTTPGTPVAVRPLANDTGAPPLSLVGFGTAGHGTVVLDAAQQALVYTPAPGFLGSDSFSYTVQDASGATDIGVVTVLVNDLPVANNDRAQTTSGVAVSIPVLANDHDAQPLAIGGLGMPGHGSVELLPDQTLRYHPQPGFVGSDSFGYTVVDPHGATAGALVTVDVTAPNRPPVAGDDAASTPVGTPVTLDLLANDNDPDGDPLTLVGLGMPLRGSLAVAADQRVTYTPPAGFRGTDEFTYTVSDGRGGQASATARVEVVRPNAPPVAPPVAATTPAGTAVTLDLLAQTSDPDGDPRELIILGLPGHGQVAVGADRRVTYTPGAGFTGTDRFTYTIRDDQGATATGEVTITVTAPPLAPTFANGYAVRRRIVLPPRPDGAPPAAPFVLRIAESGAWLRHTSAGGPVRSAQGHDIRFELEDGTKLAHEIERYDGTAGRLDAWLRLPSWNPAAAIRLLAYLGKPGLAQSEADPAATWSDYLAVWDVRSGTDRSGNGRHLNPATTEPAELLGPAARFPGTSFAVTSSAGFIGNRSALTFQCWIRGEAGTVGSSRGIIQQGSRSLGDADQGLVLRYAPNGPQGGATNVLLWGVRTAAGTALLESAANLHGTAPQALHAVWRAGELPQLYVDGIATTPSWVGAVVAGTASAGQALGGTTQAASGSLRLGVGSVPGDAGTWQGLLDEARLRASVPPPAWIALEQLSQRDPQAFYGLGDDDRPDDPAASPTAVPRSATTTASSWVDLDVLATAHVPAGTPTPTIAAVGQPANGLATIVAGKVRYTPAAGFVGSDSFTYTLAAAGKRSTARITVAVAAQPAQPEYPPALRTIQVANDAQLRSAVASARPGDHIVLADGTYSGATLSITANGTAQNPIVIRAANRVRLTAAGAVTVSGARIQTSIILVGNHLWLYGLNCDGDGWNLGAGDARLVIVQGKNCKVKRCRLYGWKGRCMTLDSGADDAEIAYCDFTVKSFEGEAGYPQQVVPNPKRTGLGGSVDAKRAFIHHNYFHDFPSKGNSYSDYLTYALLCGNSPASGGVQTDWLVERNLFHRCHGGIHTDAQVSETKAGWFTYRLNTFDTCNAHCSFRQGINNAFIANWFKDIRAVRVMDGPHKVIGNVVEYTQASSGYNRTGINILAGTIPYTTPQARKDGFVQAHNVLVAGNRQIGTTGSFLRIGATISGSATLPALNTRIEGWDASMGPITYGTHQGTQGPFAATSETWPTPVFLTPTMVGLDAP